MEEELEGQDTGQVDNSQGQNDSGTGINPAWNDLLGVIPSQLHSQITPHLQQWDKNYQEGIGKVHSQYEPWKPFIDNGISPDQVQYGLQLLNAMETRPQDIYAAMQQYFGEQNPEDDGEQDLELEQGQESTPIDITQHPQFQQLADMVNAMAELTVQQNTQQLEQQADSELEQEFKAAHEQYGDFDEKWVMVQLLANDELTLDGAVQQYQQFVKDLLTNANKPGPRVLGTGGNVPNQGADPSQLDDKGRRSLVAQMLDEARQQAG